MIIISAMSPDRVIGNGEGMPWDVPEEYQHFLDTTRDQTVILGRRSFEIFGPTLTSRYNYVITRSDGSFANSVTVSSLDEALERAAEHDAEIFVAGGASIYALAIDRADEMLLSTIKGNFTGDTYFPDFDESRWQIASREDRSSYVMTHYTRG